MCFQKNIFEMLTLFCDSEQAQKNPCFLGQGKIQKIHRIALIEYP
jgi:hypothetical protein